MASDILGLFATPQQYEQQRQAAMEAQALQQASLSPMQQGQYGIALGAQQLGRAIGGALGGVDPQLQKITQRQQLLGMIDPSNPDSYAQAINAALQTGDQEAAFLLRNEMMKAKQQFQEQQINQFKTEDYLTQRGLGIKARGLEEQAQQLIGQIKNPDGTINEQVKAQLMSFPQGQAAISQLAKVIPDLRRIGAMGAVEEDPFKIFTQDPTIPANVKTLATQYSNSLAKGMIDPEKLDVKVKELTDMTQRIQQFEQNQQTIKAQQDMMNSFKAQGMQNSQQYLALAQSNNALAKQQADFNQQMKSDEAKRKTEEKTQQLNDKKILAIKKEEDANFTQADESRILATESYDYVNRIKSGEIKFGLKDRASIAARSLLGSSDPDVVARNDFERFKTRLVNDSLRLNKGTQTEGDAQRSIKELQSAESAVDAAKAIYKLTEINAQKVSDAKNALERRRSNLGLPPPDITIEPIKLIPHTFTQRDVDRLPSKTVYIDPEGNRRVKP
jgi:hypothetical protein